MTLRFLIFCFFSAIAFNAQADHSPTHTLDSFHTLHKKGPMINRIIVKGLKRTKEHVVLRELLFKTNDILTTDALLKSIQRLKNLQIFSKVLPFLVLKENNHVELTIKIEEKWTAIPYFNFSGGGSTLYAYAGIYDINTFGRYIETGVQYDNWDGKSGGVAWFRNRRFLNKRILIGADIWSTTRPRTLYTSKGENQGEYIQDQKRLNILLEKEFEIWFKAGVSLEIRRREIIETITTDAIDNTTLSQLITARNLNQSTEVGSTFSIKLGKLNYDNYLVNGKLTTLSFKFAGKETGSDENIKKLEWKNTVFWRLPHKANIGFRFNVAAIKTNNIQNYYYIGGFENIRGYFDGQFRNKAYWQTNIEYRVPSYTSDWLVLQHIFFADAVNASNTLSDLTNISDTVYSAGIGIRIISPKIYSFNGRFDIALLSSQKTQSFISFGAQQFF